MKVGVYKLLGVIISSLILTNTTVAQDKWKLSLSNEIDLTSRSYTSTNVADLRSAQGEMRTFHNLKLKHKSNFGVHVTGRTTLNLYDKERSRLWLNQAYVTFRQGNLSLKAGKQTIKWGSLTGVSVMDLANRYDYYDYLETDKEYLGVWSGKVRYNTGPLNWTLRITESNNRSLLRLDNNRWTRMPTSTRLPQDPDKIYALELDRISQSSESNSPQVSLELDFDISALSTRLFAFRGSNDIPQRSIDIHLVEEQNITYNLELKYHDLQIYGIGQSTYANDWNLWYEVGHVRNKRALDSGGLVTDDYWNLTMGVDRMFTFEDPEKSIKWLLQYNNIVGADESSNGPMNLDHIFSNAAMMEIQYTHNYKVKFDLRTVIDLDNQGFYLNPRIRYNVSDQVHLQVATDILMGSANSFWGHYNDNTRFSFQVQYAIQ